MIKLSERTVPTDSFTNDAFRAGHTTSKSKGWVHPIVPWNGLTVTDLFCGAGGSSSGLVAAGYRIIIAANHWTQAIESHQLNHPETDHSNADISQVDPRYFPRTDILWASPECTNHSVAKGVKRQRVENEALFEMNGTRPLPDEAANRSRATMWDVPRFAEHHRYKAIIIENVVDAYRWTPFKQWLQVMEAYGYEHQLVWLNSMHAQAQGLPAPQSRDRMYIVFWRKDLVSKKRPKPNIGKWTRPTAFCAEHGRVQAVQAFKKAEEWGRYRAQYLYRCPKCAVIVEPGFLPALAAIDFTIPGERIGDRKKPLSPKTERRAQGGIDKYWRPIVMEATGNTYDSADPKHPQHGQEGAYLRAWPVDEPFRTLHTSESKALVYPPLITDGIHGEGTVQSAAVPMLTQTTAQTKGVLLPPPLLIPVEGREGKEAASTLDPMRTQTTRNETAIIVPLRNNNTAKSVREPLDTVAANGNHHALLMRHNTARGNPAQMMTPVTEPMRTVTTAGHQSLLIPAGGTWRDGASPVSEPMPTRTTVETDALLVPYYGNGTAAPASEAHRTLTTTDRYALLEAQSMSLDLDDCYFRMLTPDEIKVGMAFARDYVLLGNKREQVKQAGNAVTPPAARDLGMAVAEFLNGVELERAA